MTERTFGNRAEFELTEEDFAALLRAAQPTAYLIGSDGVEPSSPQENANRAWSALGDRLGFEYMTVVPVPDKGDRFFSAITKAPVAPASAKSPLPDAEPPMPLADAALDIPPKPLSADEIFANAVTALTVSIARDLGLPSSGGVAEYFTGLNRDLLREIIDECLHAARPEPTGAA